MPHSQRQKQGSVGCEEASRPPSTRRVQRRAPPLGLPYLDILEETRAGRWMRWSWAEGGEQRTVRSTCPGKEPQAGVCKPRAVTDALAPATGA